MKMKDFLKILASVSVGLGALSPIAIAGPAVGSIINFEADGKQLCAGYLLNENFILASASCLGGVALQDVSATAGVSGQKISPSSVINYPDYNEMLNEMNLALVSIDLPFDMSAGVEYTDLMLALLADEFKEGVDTSKAANWVGTIVAPPKEGDASTGGTDGSGGTTGTTTGGTTTGGTTGATTGGTTGATTGGTTGSVVSNWNCSEPSFEQRVQDAKVAMANANVALETARKNLENPSSNGISTGIVKVDSVDLRKFVCSPTPPVTIRSQIEAQIDEIENLQPVAGGPRKIIADCPPGVRLDVSVGGRAMKYACGSQYQLIQLSPDEKVVFMNNPSNELNLVGVNTAVSITFITSGTINIRGPIISERETSGLGENSAAVSASNCSPAVASCMTNFAQVMKEPSAIAIVAQEAVKIMPSDKLNHAVVSMSAIHYDSEASLEPDTFVEGVADNPNPSAISNVVDAHIISGEAVMSANELGLPLSTSQGNILFTGAVIAPAVDLTTISSNGSACIQTGVGALGFGTGTAHSTCDRGSRCPPQVPRGSGFAMVYTNQSFGGSGGGGSAVLAGNQNGEHDDSDRTGSGTTGGSGNHPQHPY